MSAHRTLSDLTLAPFLAPEFNAGNILAPPAGGITPASWWDVINLQTKQAVTQEQRLMPDPVKAGLKVQLAFALSGGSGGVLVTFQTPFVVSTVQANRSYRLTFAATAALLGAQALLQSVPCPQVALLRSDATSFTNQTGYRWSMVVNDGATPS
jgi:hypothetical protein